MNLNVSILKNNNNYVAHSNKRQPIYYEPTLASDNSEMLLAQTNANDHS
jgi:hypothetical protein